MKRLAADHQDFILPVPAFTVARFLAHYELFKRAMKVPGCIVDIGVGCGASTFAFAKMCRIFEPHDPSRCVYGFDTFTGFPSIAKQDGAGAYSHVGEYNYGAVTQDRAGLPIEFYKGDIEQTVPAWASANPDRKIALLNLDADLYYPTKVALHALYPLMSPGGIIIVDEYDVAEFPGEKKAVDEFFMEVCGHPPVVVRFPWYNNPSGYIQL